LRLPSAGWMGRGGRKWRARGREPPRERAVRREYCFSVDFPHFRHSSYLALDGSYGGSGESQHFQRPLCGVSGVRVRVTRPDRLGVVT
jgi:hypothetical protein